ncbi:MAG: flagellar hook-associated protein FlgK [Lachnospiraceae bacterium]|nr:flagellar hook-associated protein FlgK [Lachnospiraceae bacterium]
MSLFGDLYVGTSGLQTSQEALNVVAHNVTNTDTEGYVRQQVSQATRDYNTLSVDVKSVSYKQTGLGVYIEEVRQVRDRFIDASYREEFGRQQFYDVSYGCIEEIEEILGEMDGANFNESMSELWTAIEELVKDPSSEVCQSMLVQYSQTFAEAAKSVYNGLADYQDKLNNKIKTSVDQVNDIGHKIYQLNMQIRGIEAGGVENANDLKDQRNLLLDQLGGLCNISYNEDFFGNVLVKIEGHDFVMMDRVNDMGCQPNKETGFYDCFWPDSAKFDYDEEGNKVFRPETAMAFNMDLEISAKLDTDVGGLKGLVLARGDHRADYTDLATEETYDKVKDSVLMNVMAEFDGLVHSVVTAVNEVLYDNADPATGYLCDANGNPLQIFERISCEEYELDEATGTWTHITEDPNNSATWFTSSNLTVNQELLQYPSHLGMIRPDGSVDYQTAKALEKAFSEKEYVLNPELTNSISISEYYSNLVGQVANSGNVYKTLSENQQMTVESVEASRQGAIGVSTDEELSNMIKFQNAYNASSRFINVIDECIEHIINTLGT